MAEGSFFRRKSKLFTSLSAAAEFRGLFPSFFDRELLIFSVTFECSYGNCSSVAMSQKGRIQCFRGSSCEEAVPLEKRGAFCGMFSRFLMRVRDEESADGLLLT